MFNKALLMAVGGKKKQVVPTNGTLHSQYSFLCVDVPNNEWCGALGSVQKNDDGSYPIFEEFNLLQGASPVTEVSIMTVPIRLFYTLCLYTEGIIVCTTDLPLDGVPKICAVVNEDTGAMAYGFYGVDSGVMSGAFGEHGSMLFAFKTYEDAKRFIETEEIPDTLATPVFGLDDVEKTVTLSIYLCD